MKTVKLLGFLIFAGICALPIRVHAEPVEYAHAARGLTLSVGRGIAFRNDELESVQTKDLTLGIELKPNVLQLRVPFGSYEVDTRGNILPPGRVRAKSIGASLWLGFGGESWTPFVGAGGSFHSFQEQFKAEGNLESAFGADLYGGLRFRLVENLWDVLKLRAAIYYQATLLRPGIQIPGDPDIDNVSMHRHSVVLALEAVGL